MLTWAAAQSAIWGYDAKSTYDSTSGHTFTGSVNYIGAFTTPTLAPNGKLYSILSCASADVTGSTNSYVIAIITPGNTNSTTTNWSQVSVEYITADGSTNRPYWNPPYTPLNSTGNNSLIRFVQKGILAGNGKIYFPPFKSDLVTVAQDPKWVVLTPGTASTTTWETVTFSNTSNVSGAIGGCVLGKDGYLYVVPNTDNTTSPAAAHSFYRIHPKGVNISGITPSTDTAEIGYWTGLSSKRFFADNVNTLNWKDAAGTSYTDTATAGISKAYTQDTNSGTFSDLVVAPNGNIYMLPKDKSRGRIFYIKPSNFGTAQEICSAIGLHINQLAGASTLLLTSHSAVLQSKPDTIINNNSLGIYVFPNIQVVSGSIDTTTFNNVIRINTALNTLTSLSITSSIGGSSLANLLVSFPLANGTILINNVGAGNSKSVDQFITGMDIPTSPTSPIVEGNLVNGIITGAKNNIVFGVGNSAVNRRDFSSYHTGVNLGKTLIITNLLKITELVSVKGYAPDVTYFRSYLGEETALDSMYKIPADATTVAASLYNSQKNKLK